MANDVIDDSDHLQTVKTTSMKFLLVFWMSFFVVGTTDKSPVVSYTQTLIRGTISPRSRLALDCNHADKSVNKNFPAYRSGRPVHN